MAEINLQLSVIDGYFETSQLAFYPRHYYAMRRIGGENNEDYR